MNLKPFSLSIFFPTYNEEANIEHTVREALLTVQKITNTYEIIIVDDGSTDSTPLIADRLAAENEHVKVVHHIPNQGYGAALWSGIQAAQYEYIFFTDADLQFDFSELTILATYVPEYKVILGYRAHRRDPFFRKINAKLWNILNRFLFGLKVKDIDCAFKLMDRNLVASLPLVTRGATMSAEMLIRLERQHIPFKEVPVTHFPRTEGVATGAKPKVIIRAFKELFGLYKGQLGKVSRQQLFRFAMVGVVNTVLDFCIYIILTRSIGFFANHLLIAKIISFSAGIVSSFTLNRYWTFKKNTAFKTQEAFRFLLTVGAGMVINLATLSFFLDVVKVYDLIAVVCATILTFLWNFITSKLWVYSEVPTTYSKKLYTSIPTE